MHIVGSPDSTVFDQNVFFSVSKFVIISGSTRDSFPVTKSEVVDLSLLENYQCVDWADSVGVYAATGGLLRDSTGNFF